MSRYDDDDDRPRRSSSSGSSTVLIVVGVIFGLLLLVVLGCGFLAYFAMRTASGAMASAMQIMAEVAAAQAEAELFVTNVGSGQLDVAYDSTTTAFKARQTREQFKAFVDKNPILKNHTSAFSNQMNQNMPGGRYTTTMTITGPQGSTSCTIQVIKENDVWKVDLFTVP